MSASGKVDNDESVSLFTREWIEIPHCPAATTSEVKSPSLRGSGLKYLHKKHNQQYAGLPLYEGVD